MPYKKPDNPIYISEKGFRKGCGICREYAVRNGHTPICSRCPYMCRRLYSLIFDYPYYKLSIILKHRGGY